MVLLLFIVHSRRLNALLNSLIKRKDCWSGELKSKCPLLLRHYEGLFVLKSLIYTQAQCKLDFWLAVMRRRTVAFTQRTVGLQKDCSVTDFKNAPGVLITLIFTCCALYNHQNHPFFECPTLFHHTHFSSDPGAARGDWVKII